MELRSAGRSKGNPVTGEKRATSRQRSGLVPPAGWKDRAIPIVVGPWRRVYFRWTEMWIGYRYDRQADAHVVAFLGLVMVWAHK